MIFYTYSHRQLFNNRIKQKCLSSPLLPYCKELRQETPTTSKAKTKLNLHMKMQRLTASEHMNHYFIAQFLQNLIPLHIYTCILSGVKLSYQLCIFVIDCEIPNTAEELQRARPQRLPDSTSSSF